MKKNLEQIYKIESNQPGPIVAIFGGVHGDEKAGIMTVDYLRENLKIKSGKVYLVYGNPKAIEQGIRYTEKNLNRCFLERSRQGKTYEEMRAVELMSILDECDALLDLHAYNEPYRQAIPFAICESNCFEIVKNFDLDFVLTGIDSVEKGGTDAYMNNQGKIGICVELGAIEKYQDYLALGLKTAQQFLASLGLIDSLFPSNQLIQKVIKCTEIYKKKNLNFSFSKKYCTFDKIKKGELICRDGNEEYYSPGHRYILFPRDGYKIGIEAFILADNLK